LAGTAALRKKKKKKEGGGKRRECLFPQVTRTGQGAMGRTNGDDRGKKFGHEKRKPNDKSFESQQGQS